MSDATSESQTNADKTINAIAAKLDAHKPLVGRAEYGRVTWRRSNGKIDIALEPKL